MTTDYDDFIGDINLVVRQHDPSPDQLGGAADHLDKVANKWAALEVSG